jgi:hypothetical protein
VSASGQALPRVFDVSNNQFTGYFPNYVLSQFPKLVEDCKGAPPVLLAP